MSATALPVPDRVALKQRVLAAGAWSLAGYAVSQVIRFGSNLLMTRLLVPEMFGVMAIATIVMVGLAMFSDLGLRQSIVQSRRGNDPAFLNTAWALQILRGFLLWAIALVIAGVLYFADRAGVVSAGSVYADPYLPRVIAALSFGAIIGGFATTKSAEASRNLALGRLTQIELAAQVAGLSAMLAWAAFDRSAWVLVVGGLTATAVSTAAGHTFLPGTANRWQWDKGAVTELVGFGKWIFASSILGFVVVNADRLMLGAMVDTTTFGICVIAFLMVGVIELVVQRLMGGVALSALSEVVRRGGDVRGAYYRLHAPIAAIAYFGAGLLMTSGQALVGVLYDHRYADAGWMLQILAATLLMAPFGIAVQAYLGLGRPELHSRILFVRLVALFIAMPSGFHLFGLPGALWGAVLSQFASLPMFICYNVGRAIFDLSREVLLLPAALVGAAIGKLIVLVVA
jgi:O-antigen/teichoic acid export membrane protein